MSTERTQLMPGSSLWASFFDSKVQKVLMQRFSVPACLATAPRNVRLEFLASPIHALITVDAIVLDTDVRKSRHAQDLVRAYAEDGLFVAELLLAVTHYHQTAEEDKTLARRVAEFSDRSGTSLTAAECMAGGTPSSKIKYKDSTLMGWGDVKRLMNCKNSVEHLMTVFSRELSRRRKLEAKWREHWNSFHQLQREGRFDRLY